MDKTFYNIGLIIFVILFLITLFATIAENFQYALCLLALTAVLGYTLKNAK